MFMEAIVSMPNQCNLTPTRLAQCSHIQDIFKPISQMIVSVALVGQTIFLYMGH